MLERLGAIVAGTYYATCILVFASRLAGRPGIGHAVGWAQFALAIPLILLFVRAPSLGRPWLYYLQIGLMLSFLVVEFLLDYALRLDFRGTRWAVICYVVLFFAATGGMLGVAAAAGRGWTFATVALFLVMAVLAIVQRVVTGM